LFVAFVAVGLVPSLVVGAARRAARGRRFALAAGLLRGAAVPMGAPAFLVREAGLYSAFAAAEAGHEDECRRRVEALVRGPGVPDSVGGDALLVVLPAAAARRWDVVLDALSASPARDPLLLALEARAAAERGDVRRA